MLNFSWHKCIQTTYKYVTITVVLTLNFKLMQASFSPSQFTPYRIQLKCNAKINTCYTRTLLGLDNYRLPLHAATAPHVGITEWAPLIW